MFKPHTESRKAQYVINVPTNVPLYKVNDALKDAISYRTDDYKTNENFLPNVLPEKPGDITQNDMFGSMGSLVSGNPQAELMEADTSKAYYTVTGTMNIGSFWYKEEAAFIGAVYPSKKTTRIYLRIYYQSGSQGGIYGAISEMTSNEISKSQPALYFIAQVESKLKEKIPSLKVVRTMPEDLKNVKLNAVNLES